MPVALILLVLTLPFAIGAIIGAPYVPILVRDRRRVLELAELKSGQTLVDLGSGDGRFLRAAAAHGIHGIGYEINPFLVLVSRLVCWRYRKLVTIRTTNFWHTKLPPADAIYVFGLDRLAARLVHKFETELDKPTEVVAYIFELPGHTPVRRLNNAYVYEFGQQD
jgi:hypothetical protein